MALRATVRDGMISVDTKGVIPDGTVVTIEPVERSRRRGKKLAAAPTRPKRKSSRMPESIADSPFFGIWIDRPDWRDKSTLEIAAELREKALGRKPRR